MNAFALISELRGRGVALRADGELLRWRAADGVVTDSDRAAIRANKPEILLALATDTTQAPKSSTVNFDRTRESDAGELYRAPDAAPASGGRRVPPVPPIEALERDPYFLRARGFIASLALPEMPTAETNAMAYRLARLDIGGAIEETGAAAWRARTVFAFRCNRIDRAELLERFAIIQIEVNL